MPVIKFEVANHIALVTLNRPEAMNALDPEMAVRLSTIWQQISQDDDIRVVVVTGTGKAFCSGVDLGKTIPFLSGRATPTNEYEEQLAADGQLLSNAILRELDPGKPVIAAINGHAIAGGMELVQATDIRVAAAEAKLGVQEVKWAVFPAGGSTVRLPTQIPYVRAMELLLTGDLITAQEALNYGFLNYVVPQQEVLSKAMEIAEKIAANGPLAVKAIRASVKACLGKEPEEALKIETALSKPVFASEDAAEGPRAFLEKRQPHYTGC